MRRPGFQAGVFDPGHRIRRIGQELVDISQRLGSPIRRGQLHRPLASDPGRPGIVSQQVAGNFRHVRCTHFIFSLATDPFDLKFGRQILILQANGIDDLSILDPKCAGLFLHFLVKGGRRIAHRPGQRQGCPIGGLNQGCLDQLANRISGSLLQASIGVFRIIGDGSHVLRDCHAGIPVQVPPGNFIFNHQDS